MKCPKCGNNSLKETNINGIKIDRCDHCGGIWFDKDELRVVRDQRDENLSWLNFDLWEDEKKISISGKSIDCPRDESPLFKIKYGSTGVMVDVCLNCRGVWLDKDELDKIVSELKEKVNSETIPEYLNDLGGKVKELITRPDEAGTELRHIMIVMKLLEYRFFAQHPKIAELISILPD